MDSDFLSSTTLFEVLKSFQDKPGYETIRDVIISNLPEEEQREYRLVLSGESLPQLTSDVVAKKIFSPEEHKDRAEFLLQHITKDYTLSIDSSVQNEGYMQSIHAKKMIFDVPIRMLDKRRASIEFQVAAQDYIIERAELYSSDLLMVQYSAAVNEKKGDIDFSDVSGVIVIVLMRHSPEPFKSFKSKSYIHRFDTLTSDTGMAHSPLRKMYFVQLDKALAQFLNGEDAENDAELMRILAMMANINNKQVANIIVQSPDLSEIYEEVRRFAQDKEVQNMLLAEKYAIADLNAVRSRERTEGGFRKVYEMVSNREITPQVGARNLKITIEELKDKMLLAGFKFPE